MQNRDISSSIAATGGGPPITPAAPSSPVPCFNTVAMITSADTGNIEHLTALATAAITSPDREIRESAAQQLLFLSCYDYWEVLRRLLPQVQNNYLRFFIAKAILFIVSNELGPDERVSIQEYVLTYLHDRHASGEVLPLYIRNTLYSIFASALFSNWKLSIIRGESPEKVDSTEMAQSILSRLAAHLPEADILDCVLEILVYFSRQNKKLAISAVQNSFVREVAPSFFRFAADRLGSSQEKAAQVCSNVLEYIPEVVSYGELHQQFTDASVVVHRWSVWAPSLAHAMSTCGQELLQNPEGPNAGQLSRLLRQCSTVTSPHEEYLANRDAVAQLLLDLSHRLLQKVQEDTTRTELLGLACGLLINTFERNGEAAVRYLVSNIGILDVWAEAARFALRHLQEDDGDVRQALLHLFYLLAETLLPPRRQTPSHDCIDYSRTMDSERCILSSFRCGDGRDGEGFGTSPPMAPRGPLSSDRASVVEGYVEEMFCTYFDYLLNTAHQQPGSQELRTTTTFILESEKLLQPIIELIACERVQLLPIVIERLKQTIDQYAVCVRAQEQQAGLQSAGPTSDFEANVQTFINELNVSLALQNMDARYNLPRELSPLFFMHVALSRLSVIVTICAMAVLDGCMTHQGEVLALIADFARRLLVEDDQVTGKLLNVLSMLDDDTDDDLNIGGKPGNASGAAMSSNMNFGDEAAKTPKVHRGIIRALFFFCGCVYETHLSRQEDFYDIILNLLRFVYLYHCEQSSLVVDANLLLYRLVDSSPSGRYFLGAEKLMAVVEAVKEDSIAALRFPSNPAIPLSAEEVEARSGFFTSFVFYVETRYYAGFPIADVVSTVVERCFESDRLPVNPRQAFDDLTALSKGIQQPDTLQVMLEAAIRHGEKLSQVLRFVPRAAPNLLSWVSTLLSLSAKWLNSSNFNTTQWELTSLVMNTLGLFFSLLPSSSPPEMDGVVTIGGVPRAGGVGGFLSSSPETVQSSSGGGAAPFFRFPTDVVDADVVYSVSEILHALCTAPWCNLQVVMYYERSTLERFFCGAVELLTCTSVEMLMSAKGRTRVFAAIMVAISSDGRTFQQLRLLFMRQNLWNRLVRQLTKCLSYMYTPEVTEILCVLIRSDAEARASIPQYIGLDEYTLAATFNEIITLIAVSPSLSYREMSHCFILLESCYARAPELCSRHTERLLDFCSAYHRVRLRIIINSLRQGGDHLLERFVSSFGHSSSVGVLSAW